MRQLSTDERAERQARATRLVRARRHAGLRGAVSAARKFGWPVDTYKAHESGRNGFGIADARKYAAAFGVALGWLNFGSGTMEAMPADAAELHEPREQFVAGLPIAGEVAAGTWIEPDELDEAAAPDLFVPPDPRFAQRFQRVWIVRGRSLERFARDGQALICVVLGNGSPIEPQDGYLVIAERSRHQGGLVERTAKRLRIRGGGRYELVPEYLDAALNRPLVFSDGRQEDDEDIEARIVAVVLGVYNPLRAL